MARKRYGVKKLDRKERKNMRKNHESLKDTEGGATECSSAWLHDGCMMKRDETYRGKKIGNWRYRWKRKMEAEAEVGGLREERVERKTTVKRRSGWRESIRNI